MPAINTITFGRGTLALYTSTGTMWLSTVKLNLDKTMNPLITLPRRRKGGRVHVRLNDKSEVCHNLSHSKVMYWLSTVNKKTPTAVNFLLSTVMGCNLHSVSMECVFRRGLLFPSSPTEQICMKLVTSRINLSCMNGYRCLPGYRSDKISLVVNYLPQPLQICCCCSEWKIRTFACMFVKEREHMCVCMCVCIISCNHTYMLTQRRY